MPVEYKMDSSQTVVYVPILKMLHAMLSNGDLMDKALSTEVGQSHDYSSYRDGSRFKETAAFIKEEFHVALCMYIDDFEVSNPLGTSKKKNKMCAIYWLLHNLHPKYRSSLHSIQLAIRCKTSVVKEHGYGKVLQPLIQDLVTLEEQGLYLEQLWS